MEYYMRFLFLFWTLALSEIWAGSHFLRYFDAAMAGPELGEPRFIAVGYVDDQQFVHFDSHTARQRLEPRAEWMDQVDEDYWEDQTRVLRECARLAREHLKAMRSYFNESHGGVHTYQSVAGCELSPDLTLKRGFKQYAYDGQDYIALDSETYTWTALVPQALNFKRKWERDTMIAEFYKNYHEQICAPSLNKYLEFGKKTLKRADPPSARVTRHTAPHGEVILRCRAQDFYPKEISLTWLRDGEEQLQDTEFIETRPAGDGTFQKWAAVYMTSGQEDKYTCQVQHEGLSEPLTLQWEPQSSPTWYIVGSIAASLLLLIAVIGGVVIWRKKHSGGNGGDYVQAAGNDSAQGSDISLPAKA